MREKLHRREEVRKIVAERGLTDMFRIDPKVMRKAEGLPEEEETAEASRSNWKQGAKKVLDRFTQVTGSAAGVSYLTTNAANTAGASGLAYGYWAGGVTGFMNAVPNLIKQGKDMSENWKDASGYDRYKSVKGMIGGINGLAGNTRNMVLQAADGFAGVTWNAPGYTYTESGVNPAQLEADIGFNIINNSLVVLGGAEQIYESRKRMNDMRETNASIREMQMESIEGIKEAINDPRIDEIFTSLKDPKTQRGKFIPALSKMLDVVEDLHKEAVTEGVQGDKIQRLDYVKDYLKDNMSAFEETEKLVRTQAMAKKQANLETANGAYDVVKGSVSVAAISTRFISSPMGGIAGLIDGVTGVLGDAAFKGKFFGLEELWDGNSIVGQRNKRRAAANEVDAAISLCGDRDYGVKSATHQLVQDVIKDYNERNPEEPLPNNNDTKRSIAAKVYYELGSVERTKAGLGNNIMLKRAAELRTAAMEEPSENGPYHWCVKSLGLKCKDGELPGVDQIAQRMGCNRNWRDLVKQDEIDVKEVKWADKQAQRAEGSAADGSARMVQAKADIEQALENTTERRKFGRDVFTKRVQLEQAESENAVEKNRTGEIAPKGTEPVKPKAESAAPKGTEPVKPKAEGAAPKGTEPVKPKAEEIEKLLSSMPDVPTHEPGERYPGVQTASRDEPVRKISMEELGAMGVKTGRSSRPARQALLEAPLYETEKEVKAGAVNKPVKKQQGLR
ncbi:MAG: hypothetical protein LIP16_10720 [Clostridium sp.]|nr:hypothetical protein [Clostridium sp.]